MYFLGLGTATPPKRYHQSDCWEALRASAQFATLSTRSRAILKKVLLAENGIATRHLALDPLEEAFQIDPDTLHARFTKHAPTVAAEAARKALLDSGIDAKEIDAIIISTCTGYLCPGLTSYVTELLGLRGDVLALDLVGQGCGAAIPNLSTAHALIHSGRSKKVLSVCVEICSAAFYLDDDAGVLISACLFGDGAGAAVLSDAPGQHGRRVEWKFSTSKTVTADRDLLRFEQRNGMLRNILSPKVPELAARNAGEVFNRGLTQMAVTREQIKGWIFHAGGRDVLLALQEQLNLSSVDLCFSAKILQEFGNLSSPFVYFVLQAVLQGNVPDGFWWMASFGAGFSSHGALLHVGNSK